MAVDEVLAASRRGVRRRGPREVAVLCRQGHSSSRAAASPREVGLHRATDVVGGVEAWIAEGLPVGDGPADVRE